MNTIPVELSEYFFELFILPHLTTAKRGYVSKVPLYKIFNYILYKLHTGCQWYKIPIEWDKQNPGRKEITYQAIHHHYSKWSSDGSFQRVWENTIQAIDAFLDLSELIMDGTHTIAKRGGEAVSYQGRKKAKTSNIIPITDKNGNILASTGIIAGNHNDAFQLKQNLQNAFKSMKKLGLNFEGAYFNADAAFDTKDARKACFNHGLIPNIAENKRNRKKAKRGRKRLYNKEIYKRRYAVERSFAWVDKFRSLMIRHEVKEENFLGSHFVAFAMVNLRNLIS